VLYFQHIFQVCSKICRQQASECPMQRMLLAAVCAPEERLIAPRYLMQISAHLEFSCTKHVGYCSLRKTLVGIYGMHLGMNLICIHSFCPHASRISVAKSPYLMFINDVSDVIAIKTHSCYSELDSLQTYISHF